MPNLDYDPKNPTDLLGQPIEEGDYVAWGTTWGRSPAVAVCVIDKIRFTQDPTGYGPRVECEREHAESYTLRLRPIRSTGDVTWIDKDTGKERWGGSHVDDKILAERERYEAKSKSVSLVRNVVKLDPEQVEAAMHRLQREAQRRLAA